MKKVLTNLDLNLNEIQNTVIHHVATDPVGGTAGQVIFNTTSREFKYYNGSGWIVPSAGGITGTVTVAQGGTGVTTIPAGEVVVGNGTNSVTTIAIDTTVTSDSENLITSGAVSTALSAIVSSMKFKGTLADDTTITSGDTDINGSTLVSLSTYEAGWTFTASAPITVATSGFDKDVEVGDMVLAIASKTESTFSASDWVVIQANIDGAVTGPSTAVNGNIAVFDGTTGKIIKDGGKLSYTENNTLLTSSNGVCTWEITHNLGSKYANVTVYEVSTGASVITEVIATSETVTTIKINSNASINPDTYCVVITK